MVFTDLSTQLARGIEYFRPARRFREYEGLFMTILSILQLFTNGLLLCPKKLSVPLKENKYIVSNLFPVHDIISFSF